MNRLCVYLASLIMIGMMTHFNTAQCSEESSDYETDHPELFLSFSDAQTADWWTTVNDNVMGGNPVVVLRSRIIT